MKKKKIKEILKLKYLKKVNNKELFDVIKQYKDNDLIYILKSLISYDLFDIECGFLTEVGSRKNEKEKFNTNSLYDLLVLEKGLKPKMLETKPLKLYVQRKRGLLKNIEYHLFKYKYRSENYTYDYIYDIKFIKKK